MSIKIQNIYYMLAYAFQTLKNDSYAQLGTEDFENSQDLLAAILETGLSNLIRSGIGREYVLQTEVRTMPVGKICVTQSIKHNTLQQRKLVCEFDEFTENTYANQILKTTAILMMQTQAVTADRRNALRKNVMFLTNVDTLPRPRHIAWNTARIHRHNTTYKMLLFICRLYIDSMLQTENGKRHTAHFINDEQLSRLYERFILNYCKTHYEPLGFKVHAPQIKWGTDLDTLDEHLLPTMQTDITLRKNGQTLIIDAKFYARSLAQRYDSRSLHSHNLYQIFTYVQNEQYNTPHARVAGLLLYAQTDEDTPPHLDRHISGNRIAATTLNLNADFSHIRRQLDTLRTRFFDE